jgi:hypothetical protein
MCQCLLLTGLASQVTLSLVPCEIPDPFCNSNNTSNHPDESKYLYIHYITPCQQEVFVLLQMQN